MDRTAGGEDARHEYDIPDFEGQRVVCLIVEDGLGEGDEALAPGAAESDMWGLKARCSRGKPFGLQGVL